MCITAWIVRKDGLASALDIPLTELVFDASFTHHAVGKILKNPDRICLCPVDIRATAEKAGFSCDDPTWDGRSRHSNSWNLRRRVPPFMTGTLH
jgi:hypothetical protein